MKLLVWAAAVVFVSCAQPCEPLVDIEPQLTMLVTNVEPSSVGILRITAHALNAPPDTDVFSTSGRRVSSTWADGPIAGAKTVSFLLEGDDSAFLQMNGPLNVGDAKSNLVTVRGGKVDVERPATGMVLASRTKFNMITLLVSGAGPTGVHLSDGRGTPLRVDQFECLDGPTPWMTDVSECWVWFDSGDVGFRGSRLRATVDTPSGPQRTPLLGVR